MVKKGVIALIKIYQWTIAPLLGECCRFSPSCSHYMEEAIRVHGMTQGIGLGLKRLIKCHPWHPGGDDPVPPRS